MTEIRFDVYSAEQIASTAADASGAKKVGLAPVTGLTATQLQAAIAELLELIGTGGAPNASATVKGIVLLTATPADPANPKAVGDNDTRMADSRAPKGAAGGDLSGTYPDPTLAGVSPSPAGTYDRATITVDAKGRVVSASTGAAGLVADASPTTKGAAFLSRSAVDPANPIVVGDNDPRVRRDVVNVADFGADPSKTPAENRAAIQAAVDDAQTRIVRSNFFAHSPVVYFPYFGDVLLTDATVMVSEPIILRGASRYAHGVKITTDAPAFTVQAPLRVAGNANYVEDQRATFSEMCIRGTFDSAMPNQDGIRQIAPADRHIPRFTVENCVIRDMGGYGINSADAVSNRFMSNIIHRCRRDGIFLTGIYNTDFYIHDCRLRICARGLNVSPAINPNTGVPYRFSTGFVGGGTVIEGNCLGTGALGSSTKPGAGIRMVSVADMAIQNVYFEGHLNDIHGDDWRGVVIENTYHSAGSNNAPKTYFGGASPARRPCAMHITNAANKNNVIRSSWIYKPQKPADTTDTEWGTASYGTTYNHLPVLQGGPWVLDRPKEESTDNEIAHSGGPSLVTHVRALDRRYPAGSGPILQSADGASTKRVTLNSAGTGLVFVDAS